MLEHDADGQAALQIQIIGTVNPIEDIIFFKIRRSCCINASRAAKVV